MALGKQWIKICVYIYKYLKVKDLGYKCNACFKFDLCDQTLPELEHDESTEFLLLFLLFVGFFPPTPQINIESDSVEFYKLFWLEK